MRRLRLELDSDVWLKADMILSVTLHTSDGTIRTCRVRHPIDDPKKYIGTLPYQWIDPTDHDKVRAAIAAASKGKSATVQYMLLPSFYGGKGYMVETEFSPSGAKESPVLGISVTAPALPKLTEAERELFREIAASGNTVLHRKKSSTARVARTRLAKKLKISTSQLQAFCLAYVDLL